MWEESRFRKQQGRVRSPGRGNTPVGQEQRSGMSWSLGGTEDRGGAECGDTEEASEAWTNLEGVVWARRESERTSESLESNWTYSLEGVDEAWGMSGRNS